MGFTWGIFCNIGVSLEDIAEKKRHKAKILADCLNQGIGQFLDENKSPSCKVNELTTGEVTSISPYTGLEALAKQENDSELQTTRLLSPSLFDLRKMPSLRN